MKNVNIEYDMDENDLDIILRDIVKEHKKKPTLTYIFENYSQLLSVFRPHVIKKTLEGIPEAYEYAPNEGEEDEKKKDEFEDEPHDIESDPESIKEEGNFARAFDKLMSNLNEAHVPEGDDEGRMIEYQLRTIRDEIDELLPLIKPNDQFEGWVQSKVTLAKDYVSAVRDYLKQHYAEYHSDNDGDQGSHDLSDDAEALASAGHGTDEDYGYYGNDEDAEGQVLLSDDRAAKIIADKIKGTPNLNIQNIKLYVKKYLAMVGKAPNDVDYISSLVYDILDSQGMAKESVVEEKKGARCTKVTGQMQSTRSDKKYMRCARVGGKLKRVHYGDPKRRIKKSNPKKRRSFRARHKCSTAKPGTAKYFSCKNWIFPFVSALLPLIYGIHTLV